MPIAAPYRGLGAPTALAWYERARATVLVGSGTLTTPNSTSKAITYDPDLAPIGAAMTATIIPTSEGSTAEFTVLGLVPNRGYAVSAYTKACGATASAAGTRFQYHLDPAATSRTTSGGPRHATSGNEISLEVRTDAAGVGTSRTTVPFTLTDRVPGSMVVHDETQSTSGSDQAVQVDAPIACLTLSKR
jgi:Cu-Zn family superoxide dismutase